MMQKTSSKKLSVRRLTLRQLSGLDLTQARGGDSEATCVTHLVLESEATCATVKCVTR